MDHFADPNLDMGLPIEDFDDDKAGLIVPQPGQKLDGVDTYAYPIADDILYNILHSILLDVHRSERLLRSHSAGIAITQEAQKTFAQPPPSAAPSPKDGVPGSAPSTPRRRRVPQHQVLESDAALYEDGIVTIKGNPLEHVPVDEIRCEKCGKRKVLYPISGNGAKPPPRCESEESEGEELCARRPWVDAEGCDIYGLQFPRDDVSTTKRSNSSLSNKPTEKKMGLNQSIRTEAGEDTSFDSSTATDNEAIQQPQEQKVVFPNVECPRCPRMVNVRIFAKHLNGHLRSGGRASGRAAALKIASTEGGGSREASRKSTPNNGLKVGGEGKKEEDKAENAERSPKKRDRSPMAAEAGRERKRVSLPDNKTEPMRQRPERRQSENQPQTRPGKRPPQMVEREAAEERRPRYGPGKRPLKSAPSLGSPARKVPMESTSPARKAPLKSLLSRDTSTPTTSSSLSSISNRDDGTAEERRGKDHRGREDSRDERSREERDKEARLKEERQRIMKREMERQKEREITMNKTFMAAKRKFPDRVVKKWKSGKVTVDGKVWENC